jgi:predicted ribonuclease YlaK
MDITRLDSRNPGFHDALERLLDWEQSADLKVEATVRDIIAAVRAAAMRP